MGKKFRTSEPMPPGFEGGPVELWEREHTSLGEESSDALYFRSAPARAILQTLEERGRPAPGDRVLELGCGNSRWLAHLASRPGVEVYGVDFSPTGVETARQRLVGMPVDPTQITLGPIDEYTAAHEGQFDVVMSFGLIEHFFDLNVIISSHVRCARPGGRVFVTAPNLSGANLYWARLVAGDIFSYHHPISARLVSAAFNRLGCTHVNVHYLGGPRWFAVPTSDGCPNGTLRTLASLGRKAWNGAGEGLYRTSPRIATRAAGPWLSPHFAVSATVGAQERAQPGS